MEWVNQSKGTGKKITTAPQNPDAEAPIEAIIDKRWNNNTQCYEWLIKWMAGDETWEPRQNFVDVLANGDEIINKQWEEYEAQHAPPPPASPPHSSSVQPIVSSHTLVKLQFGANELQILASADKWMNDEIVNSYFGILQGNFPDHLFADSFLHRSILNAEQTKREVRWCKVCYGSSQLSV